MITYIYAINCIQRENLIETALMNVQNNRFQCSLYQPYFEATATNNNSVLIIIT